MAKTKRTAAGLSLDALADVVATVVKAATEPLAARIAALEARHDDLKSWLPSLVRDDRFDRRSARDPKG